MIWVGFWRSNPQGLGMSAALRFYHVGNVGQTRPNKSASGKGHKANMQERNQTSKQANKQAKKQTNKLANKQTSKHVSKTSKQAHKQISNNNNPQQY